jgi:DNA-binding transcriptional LysR family regulator
MTTRVDIKHLQALLGIADHGSFSAAAEALGTVQSNVSAHVARLERELDAVLIDRTTGQLTEAGGIVAARARRIAVELDAIVADLVALRSEVVGTVRLGMIGTTGRWLVPTLFRSLHEHHPHIHLNVLDGSNSSLELQLMAGLIDVAVVTLPVKTDELNASVLFEEDLVLVVQVDHPLAREADAQGLDALPIAALADVDLILPLSGTPLRNEIDAAVRPARIRLRPLLELDGLRMIASLTFDGYGPAILPATSVPDHLRAQFRSLPLEGFPRRQVGIALQARGLPSAPTRVVIDVLQDLVRDPATLPEGLHPVIWWSMA